MHEMARGMQSLEQDGRELCCYSSTSVDEECQGTYRAMSPRARRRVRVPRAVAVGFTALAAVLCAAVAASAWLVVHRRRVRSRDVVQQQERREEHVWRFEEQNCCSGHRAECLACAAGQSNMYYCSQRRHFAVPGCGDFCGFTDEHFDYFGGDLYSLENIESQFECCARCRAEPKCTTWSWGRPDAHPAHARRRCYLKRQLELRRYVHPSSISGFPGKAVMSFQIKNRHGLCADWQGDQAFLAECGDASHASQQWSVDLAKGMIMTQEGNCLGSPEWKSNGGLVHLRPCAADVLGQHWILEGSAGLIKNNAGYCIEAPRRNVSGGKLQMWRCHLANMDQQWSLWFTELLAEPKTAVAMRMEATTQTTTTFSAPGSSLYCYSLMLPAGDERGLISSQAAGRKGIFACDEATVFSSESVDLGSGWWTQVLYNTNVYCTKGGKWGTYMNTPVFVKIWREIIAAGRYKYHDWNVKVDPDAVFLPERLRQILRDPEFREAEVKNGAVLHNCGRGLHGPLEVISRRGMEIFGNNTDQCERKPQEDFFLSLCMDKLGVKVHFRDDVLAESGCMLKGVGRKDPKWYLCQSAHVAFHPFKTWPEYEGCYERALGSWAWKAM